jgi:tetratricopeptide (TPR) repeat protein
MSMRDFPSKNFPWSNGIIHFTRILGAVNSNDIEAAKKDLVLLSQCHEYLLKERNQYMADQVLIMVKAAEAWIQFFEGNKEDALTLMTTSAEIEMNTDKQSLTPGEVLPAQELLGDLLIKLDKPSKALEAYQLNLKIRPNRFNSIYGAAIASKQSGNNEKAKMYFEQLLKLAENSNSDRRELIEAKEFIGKSS